MERGTRLGLLLGLGLLLVASGARAQQAAELYLTYGPDDRGMGGPIGIVPGTATPVHVWLAGGGSVSMPAPCANGANGSEICGFNLVLRSSGLFQFNDFVGDTSFDSSGSGLPFKVSLTPSRLAINALDLGAPGIGNRHLGELTVTATGASQSGDMIISGAVVRSNLVMADVVAGTILLPEPAVAPALAASALALAAFARSRGRRKA